MNEINFFEENIIKEEYKFEFKYAKLTLSILVVISFLGIFGWSYVLKTKNVKLNTTVLELENAKNLLVNSQNNNIVNPNKDEDSLLEFKKRSIVVIGNVENYSKVSEELLIEIKDAIPDSLFLNDFTIVDGNITITGYAISGNTVARFQNSLEKTENIKDVFVSSIINDYGNFNFTLTAKVGS